MGAPVKIEDLIGEIPTDKLSILAENADSIEKGVRRLRWGFNDHQLQHNLVVGILYSGLMIIKNIVLDETPANDKLQAYYDHLERQVEELPSNVWEATRNKAIEYWQRVRY